MKFLLPPGCGPVSHAGKALTIAADKSVDLDPSNLGLLEPHGIIPIGDPPAIDMTQIDKLAQSDLVAALTARGITPSVSASLATLRALLRQAIAKGLR